jgi:hypothetical protein
MIDVTAWIIDSELSIYQGRIQELKFGGGGMGLYVRQGVLGLPSGSRAKPWWGPSGQSPQKFLDFRDFMGI